MLKRKTKPKRTSLASLISSEGLDRESLKAAADQLRDRANDLGEQLAPQIDQLRERATDLGDQLAPRVEQLRDRAGELGEQLSPRVEALVDDLRTNVKPRLDEALAAAQSGTAEATARASALVDEASVSLGKTAQELAEQVRTGLDGQGAALTGVAAKATDSAKKASAAAGSGKKAGAKKSGSKKSKSAKSSSRSGGKGKWALLLALGGVGAGVAAFRRASKQNDPWSTLSAPSARPAANGSAGGAASASSARPVAASGMGAAANSSGSGASDSSSTSSNSSSDSKAAASSAGSSSGSSSSTAASNGSGSGIPEGAIAAKEDGSSPDPDYVVKGNADSGLYHEPGGRWYDATVAEFWFKNADDAQAAGFRKAGSPKK